MQHHTLQILVLVGILSAGCKKVTQHTEQSAAPAASLQAASVSPGVPAAENVSSSGGSATQGGSGTPSYRNPMTPCCVALAKIAVSQNDAAYTAASEACGAGMMSRQTLPQIRDQLVGALAGKPLPTDCGQ